MNREPDFLENLRAELSGGRQWLDRAIVLGYAVAAGLFVVGFTIASDRAFALFRGLYGSHPWAVLLWTPAATAAIVWATRRWAPAASGSGIPQVKAALHPALPHGLRSRFVSLRLTLAKIGLAVAGFGAGLSIGREGPAVQVAAGLLQHSRRWLSPGTTINRRSLILAGGAAGIAAAFNAPLAGVVFAIEELSGRIEAKASGLIITAIVLAGLVAVSVFGNFSYFGVIKVPRLGIDVLGPGLGVALVAGVAGGLFSKLMASSLTAAPERLNRWRQRWPVRFAAGLGLAVAVIGLASGGATFGSGSETVKELLAGQGDFTPLQTLLKFIATWLTAWCGVPGGIFAPSLTIGAGIGEGLSQLAGPALRPALIAMGMAGFLAAVTQAPLTAFIIVMEMVDGHSMVLSLMACAMGASLVARMITRPLYEVLADFMVSQAIGAPLPPRQEEPAESEDSPPVP
ncbi:MULTISPECIES: chloride channel protein [Variovorax]|jgi:H+/Cl- antiporter ClcA|uniref:Chloride channel protein n=1 Tax=Variovorax ginsengisoli TaxID=363844 RepID=A0ABT8S9B9_9BURK|nr:MULTISPECIES: chloride channel protein [Variovorax]MDM0081452.1 chloride channel protein [Variovorax sp. J31P179]MDN8614851.1 chloride channel protein [Variovorax ginsengisoli]MDO1534021.1 chloride channel protein [Variovorax ginsengisoli]HET7837064.1 chloride channel protein [Variovorax sp.]